MASLLVILRLAMSTLWENKLRSALTLIGMVFGNAAVIATLSSNEGAKQYIAKQLESLGNKLMTVTLTAGHMSDHDLAVLERFADEVEFGVREQVLGDVDARADRRVTKAQMVAVDQDYFKAVNMTLDVGRLALGEEMLTAEPVVFLGAKVRDALFGSRPFMNQFITITRDGSPLVLKVIGVFREKGGTAGASLDGSVFISPALGRKIANDAAGKVLVLLKDDNRASAAKNQIRSLFSTKFGQGIEIVDAREAIERTREIWGKQNLVGIVLASISLLTGGVGIMNIMLLSIHQRQKEIGLRKAVGARNSEIASQFLMETIIICLLGALLGVMVGWAFGKQVAGMLGDWEASMSLVSVVVALTFSVLTGIIFGALPAMRASRIDPYDALRTG